VNLASRLVKLPPGLAWHRARLATPLYRRAFATFGAGSVIVRPQVLRGTQRIFVGERCAFYPGAWLACEDGGGPLRIGGDNYFGHRTHLHAADPLTIGDGCVFADDVYIGTTDHDRDVRSRSHGSGPVTIGDRVFLGQRVTVLGGVTIGDGATVGAHSVVTKDVRPGAVVAGVPAREIGRD
jgi:acetyltransferase-like isoleucine patch superfamily enzyme